VPGELNPGDWAVLGALAERPAHGFALAQVLDRRGPLGRIWTVPRPAIYQVLRKLEGQGLVSGAGREPGARGPQRTVYRLTLTGQQALDAWLVAPVDHVRDGRSLLLLKLALLDRAGRDPTPLLLAQRPRVAAQVEALAAARPDLVGFERTLLAWRLSSSRAMLEFVDGLLGPR
jgi:DNA-binding PadR family transcriptional regulator